MKKERRKKLKHLKKWIAENALLNIASREGKNDLSKIKTVGLHSTGGNPSLAPDKPAADATSTFPVDQLSMDNIQQTPPDVNDKRNKISE